jgi:hypothetical protein
MLIIVVRCDGNSAMVARTREAKAGNRSWFYGLIAQLLQEAPRMIDGI